MTTINSAFFEDCRKFLHEVTNESIRSGKLEVKGMIPNGPAYKVIADMNKHTKIGKFRIELKYGETYKSIYGGEYRLGDKELKLNAIEVGEFYYYTRNGICNVINLETDFTEHLDNMLNGATHTTSVDHFTGVTVKYHSDDDSQRFMIGDSKRTFYALEEAIQIQDGFAFTAMASAADLKAKTMQVLKDYIEAFELEDFEHTFSQPE